MNGSVGERLKGSALVPALVLTLVISSILMIPLKVTGAGYLPPDDALRHAAKVVSARSWSDILVLRNGITVDSHTGWHAILDLVHNAVRCNLDCLVVFSVVSLFVLFCLVPAAMLRRPESWLIALLVTAVANPDFIPMRLFLGRPYILTMSVVLAMCFLWPRLKAESPSYKTMLAIIFLVAASTWIHCSWYLFALPVVSFFFARQWRAALRMAFCVLIGITLGAFFTGEPYVFLEQTLFHGIRAFSEHQLQRMLVFEFKPFAGDGAMVMTVFFLMAWRHIRGKWNREMIDNPVFILGILGWVLGFVSTRFWVDWGMPAILVWIALEFQAALEDSIPYSSRRRLLLTLSVCVVLYAAVTNDAGGRWTNNLAVEYVSADDPELKEWLPAPGGTVYNDQMEVFYETFYSNPHAPWRYVLGFEPTMMPPEDLAIFRNIQWHHGAYKAFEPWVQKMSPQDRIILKRRTITPPNMPGIEWRAAGKWIWIGRPEKNSR